MWSYETQLILIGGTNLLWIHYSCYKKLIMYFVCLEIIFREIQLNNVSQWVGEKNWEYFGYLKVERKLGVFWSFKHEVHQCNVPSVFRSNLYGLIRLYNQVVFHPSSPISNPPDFRYRSSLSLFFSEFTSWSERESRRSWVHRKTSKKEERSRN